MKFQFKSHFTQEYKDKVVKFSFIEGVRIKELADLLGISAANITRWRKDYICHKPQQKQSVFKVSLQKVS